MEKKSGRIIFQQNVKEENELLKSKESENQKSHKSLRIKLDLFDKTKLHLDKQNVFKNLYNRKIKVIHSKINLSPKNQAQMFLTIASHPKTISQNLTVNYNQFEDSKYDNFVNSKIEKIKSQKKIDFNKVLKKREEINQKRNIFTSLYKKHKNSRNPSQNILSSLFTDLYKLSSNSKEKNKDSHNSYKSLVFPPINFKSLSKPIKIRNKSNFNLRKNVSIDLFEQVSNSIITEHRKNFRKKFQFELKPNHKLFKNNKLKKISN